MFYKSMYPRHVHNGGPFTHTNIFKIKLISEGTPLIQSWMTFSWRIISSLDRFDSSKNIRYLLARANQRPGRRRLIKIARTRFGGIAAAVVGRFSTIRPTLSLSLVLSLRPSSRSFLCIPRLTALLVVLVLHFCLPAVPALSARPRLAGPFGVVYAPGIQMTAFARPEECPTISARLRSPTTRLQRGIQPLVSRFSFFFPSPSLLSPPSCLCPATCCAHPRVSRAGLSFRSPPFQLIHVSIVHQNAFRPDDCYQPLSLIARPRAPIVSMNSALNADERDTMNRHRCESPSKSDIRYDSCVRQKNDRNQLRSFFYFYITALYTFEYY